LKTKPLAIIIGIIAVGVIGLYLTTDNNNNTFDTINNRYQQIGSQFELFGFVDTSTICKDTVKMFYKTSSGYSSYGSSSFSYYPVTQDLSSRASGETITGLKGEIWVNCDLPSGISSLSATGTYLTIFEDGWGRQLGFNWLHTESGSLNIPGLIYDGVDKKLSIFTVSQSELDKIEKGLTTDSLGRVAFTTTTDLADLKWTTNTGVTQNSPAALMQSSMRFNQDLEPISPDATPDVATNINQPFTIETVYQTITTDSIKNGVKALDTTTAKGNQITITMKMNDWLSEEGKPQADIKKPNGALYQRVAFTLDHMSGDDAVFLGRVSIPQLKDPGTWKIEGHNINRNSVPTATFIVTFTAPTPDPVDSTLPQDQCEASGGTYDTASSSCTLSISNPTTPTQTDEITYSRIGIIWTAVDKSDNKIDGGDSRSDGTAGELIGNLVPQSVISETILTNADTSIGFKHYGIKPYFTISESNTKSGIDLAKVGKYQVQSSFIKMDMTMIDGSNPTPITKGVIPSTINAAAPNEIIPLGELRLTVDDVENIAKKNSLDIGDVFTVEAKLKGDFTIVDRDSGQVFLGSTDGTVFTQNFVFGKLTPTSTDKETETTDDKDIEKEETNTNNSNNNPETNTNNSNNNPTWLCKNTGFGCQDIEPAETIPLGDPQTKTGVAAICEDGTFVQCVSAELQNALGEENTKDLDLLLEDTDNTTIYFAIGVVVVLTIIMGLIMMRRKRYSY
jgi:hypothetical protein